MTADHASGTPETPQFLVRPDGSVVGDDGASGSLAAALPYTGRLARRMGELVGVGDLRLLEAFGVDHLIVGVTWTPAGEGTFRAVVAPPRAAHRADLHRRRRGGPCGGGRPQPRPARGRARA